MKTSKEQMSEREFNETFMPHTGLIRSCVQKQYQNIDISVGAEDLVQEILLKAWRARGKYDGQEGTPQTWLATIARNTMNNYWRTFKKRPTVSLEEVSQKDTPRIMPKYNNTKNYTPEDINNGGLEEFEKYLFGDKASIVNKCGIKIRRTGYLRHYFEMSVKETSAYEGITPETVKMRSHRFKKELSLILEEN